MSENKSHTKKKKHSKKHIINKISYLFLSISFISAFIPFFKNWIEETEQKKHNNKEDNNTDEKDEENLSQDLDELIQLSQNNANAFYLKFIEVFPNLYDTLVKLQPKLSDSEIKFCMYLKLGYSTKEIAIHTNSTIKSVESKKYRLRRKLKDKPNPVKYIKFTKQQIINLIIKN